MTASGPSTGRGLFESKNELWRVNACLDSGEGFVEATLSRRVIFGDVKF